MGKPAAQVSVAAGLRLFLKPSNRAGPVWVDCDGVSSLGHVVQSLGIPLTEVGLLEVNGHPVPPRYRPSGGDVVDVAGVGRPQAVPVHRFLLDVHLGALARRLRLVGVDTAYATDASDDAPPNRREWRPLHPSRLLAKMPVISALDFTNTVDMTFRPTDECVGPQGFP